MAKSSRVTAESVAAEADKLVMAGERPTIERLRAKLGGGSPNTIAPLLNEWFADLGKRLKQEHVLPATRGVPPAVLRLYEEVRADLVVLAEERIAEGIASARAAAEEAERKEAMAWQALRDIEAQLGGMRESVAHQKETIDTLQASLASSRDQHIADRARVEDLERQLTENQRRRADESAKAAAEVVKANNRADETVKRVMKDLDAERTAHKATKKHAEKLEERLDMAGTAAAAQRADAAEAAEAFARVSAELAAAQRLLANYSDDLTVARSDVAEMLRRSEADLQRLADLGAENAVLRERLQAGKPPALRISTSTPSKGARRLKTASARR